MLPNDSLGSKAVRLRMNTCFPVCARKRTYLPILELLPPPALGERRHRGLACRLVAMRWPTVFVMAEGQRPHPRRTNRRGVDLKDAADYITIGQHIVIVITPLTGRSARRGTLEDQIVLVHFTESTRGASLDHPVGAAAQWQRNRQPKRPGGLEVDDQLGNRGLLDGQLCRFGALENAAGIGAQQPILLRNSAPVAHQSAGRDKGAILIDRRQCIAKRQSRKPLAPAIEEWIVADHQSAGS